MDMQEYIDKHSTILKEKDEELKQKVEKVQAMQKLMDSMYEEFQTTFKQRISSMKDDIDTFEEDLEACEEVSSKLAPRNMFDSTENLVKGGKLPKSVKRERFIDWLYES